MKKRKPKRPAPTPLIQHLVLVDVKVEANCVGERVIYLYFVNRRRQVLATQIPLHLGETSTDARERMKEAFGSINRIEQITMDCPEVEERLS